MQPEALKLLVDVHQALGDIGSFTVGMSLAEFQADAKCRAAVERKFEILGEACCRIRDRFPDIFAAIPDGPQIIGFRNRIIHGYDDVDEGIVWDVVSRKLPSLAQQIERLLR